MTNLSVWPSPALRNSSCINAVQKVTSAQLCGEPQVCDETLKLTLLFLPFLQVKFVIFYTGRGELTSATVDITLADVNQSQLLLQTHSVEFQVEPKEFKKTQFKHFNVPSNVVFLFQLTKTSPTPAILKPAVGLKVGSPLIGRFLKEAMPVS